MPIPKNITFVTFDVYGTLIDWETGIYEAFAKEAERDGFEIDRNVLIPLFHEISQEIEAGSYELYAEVLRRTAIEIANRLEWKLEPSRSGFLPDSVQRWKPFKETATQLTKLAKKHKLGLISNIDDKLLGQTRRHIPMDFDLVVTAQQVRSYKPDPATSSSARGAWAPRRAGCTSRQAIIPTCPRASRRASRSSGSTATSRRSTPHSASPPRKCPTCARPPSCSGSPDPARARGVPGIADKCVSSRFTPTYS